MQTDNLGLGQYNLTVRGSRGLEFSNTTKLEYNAMNMHGIFIQTDKKRYKAGQTIHFRVVILDPKLKPSITEPIDIFITVRLVY